jgi:hypothetical protein
VEQELLDRETEAAITEVNITPVVEVGLRPQAQMERILQTVVLVH